MYTKNIIGHIPNERWRFCITHILFNFVWIVNIIYNMYSIGFEGNFI